ncbi:MAG: GNAT family N-acetyltransferase [Pirellulaceae bacterium]|nr:GNAT family N-acetyltransferase [Planctomycetales bacterium]
MTIEYDRLADAELDGFVECFCTALGFRLTGKQREAFDQFVERDRMRVLRDQGQVVGTLGAHSLKMVVPGGTCNVAGTTLVGVLPTHRRRGLLRKFIEHHLSEVHALGEPLAALWASEGSIYGQFGYGLATERTAWKIPRTFAALHEGKGNAGECRLVDADEAFAEFPQIHDSQRDCRPGFLYRRAAWWSNRILSESHPAFGDVALRRILYSIDGSPSGYAIYHTSRQDSEGGLQLHVREVCARDEDSERSIWQCLTSVDLVESIHCWNLPADHPLRWWLKDVQKSSRTIAAGMWLRIISVETALTARHYRGRGRLVLEVHDEQCPWNCGRFQLEVHEDGTAECTRTSDSPDIVVPISALSSVYLGNFSWEDQRRCGAVSGAPDRVQLADAIFSWEPAAWCPERF